MLLTQKTKVLLAHAYSMLEHSEKLAEEKKGTLIVDKKYEAILREKGKAMMKYCEQNGCTREYLANVRNKSFFYSSKIYYDMCMKNYSEHIDADSTVDTHIPFLYAFFMMEMFFIKKMIGLDLEYSKINNILYKSKVLQDEARPSKFNKEVIVYSKKSIKLYHNCTRDAIEKVMNTKVFKANAKKNTRKQKQDRKKRK